MAGAVRILASSRGSKREDDEFRFQINREERNQQYQSYSDVMLFGFLDGDGDDPGSPESYVSSDNDRSHIEEFYEDEEKESSNGGGFGEEDKKFWENQQQLLLVIFLSFFV